MTGSEPAQTRVLLPVRSFRHGKSRLGREVSAERRRALARAWADRVRRAAGALPVTVTSDDAEVAEWAASTGAEVIADAAGGLDGAVGAAVRALGQRGARRVVIAHADLPLADDLTWIEALDGVVIVPDRRGDGTNVLAVPADAPFRFGYGPASSRRHRAEARRLGLRETVVRDPLLGWDVDVPEDLGLPRGAELARLRGDSRRVREAAAAAPARVAGSASARGGRGR